MNSAITLNNLCGFTLSFKVFVFIPQNYVLKMLQEEYSQQYDPWIKHIDMIMFLVRRQAFYYHHKRIVKIMRGG